MIRYLGLDVHREECVFCLMDGAGKVLARGSFASTRDAIEAFAERQLTKQDVAALEATFHSRAICRALAPFVARVVVSNPLKTKAIAESQIKTDKVDAAVLAHLLRCNYLPAVWQPDEETARLRRLTHRRATLVSDRTTVKNRIHSVLAQSLICLEVDDLFSCKGRVWLAGVQLAEDERSQVQSDLRLLTQIEQELEAVDRVLYGLAWKQPQVRLLMTLPGVDCAVAQAVLAALGDISRFRDADHAASYLGLTPSTHQSAGHCYHGPITKRGSRTARWMLVQAAQHAGLHHGPVGAFFKRLRRKKNYNVAVVACARKLVVLSYHMLKNNEPYRYAAPKSTEQKLGRLRVRTTGQKRKTGPLKGTPQPDNYGAGVRLRRAPAIGQVYDNEGLPPITPMEQLKPAEQRILREQGVDDFVASIEKPTVTSRKAAKRRSVTPCATPGGSGPVAVLAPDPPAAGSQR